MRFETKTTSRSFLTFKNLNRLLPAIIVFALTVALVAGPIPLALGQSGSSRKDTKTHKLTEEQKIIHLLNRIAYGPKPGDIERVRQMGINRYIDQQLYPERIDDSVVEQKLKEFETINLPTSELFKYQPPNKLAKQQEKTGKRKKREPSAEMSAQEPKGPQFIIRELQQAKLMRAIYSERQLNEIMADFWTNHFNVFAGKGADKWLITSYERDVIRPNAMGKFKDLLLATAKSPAMLFYLDNWMSVDPTANLDKRPDKQERRERRRNQNQRRKNILNRRLGALPPITEADRAMKRQRRQNKQQEMQAQNIPQKNRRPTGLNENYARELMELHTLGVDGGYTQKDVTEVARCFTGWSIRAPRQAAEFFFYDRAHDRGEKTVLGVKIPAGGGIEDGEKVIDILVRHPSTARFISTKLARRFVSDNPPPQLVNRAAEVFRKTDGDIREVVRAIITSPEFFSVESYRAKVKKPIELVASAARALGADTTVSPQLAQAVARMGEPLFMCQPPTGYPDVAEAWINTGALLTRMNFAFALSANQIPGTRFDLQRRFPQLNSKRHEQKVDYLIKELLRGDASQQTRSTLLKELDSASNVKVSFEDDQERSLEARLTGLILGSSEFQRR